MVDFQINIDLKIESKKSIQEEEYEAMAVALYYIFAGQSKGAMLINETAHMLRALGLYTEQIESGLTNYEDIWFNPVVKELNPGDIAQVSWFKKSGPHAFLIGRLHSGKWFLSDQGERPATELQADDLPSLKKEVDSAAERGYSIFMGKVPIPTPAWTGVILLKGPGGVEKAFEEVVPPNTFLAEVDPGLFTVGERLYTKRFVSKHYDFTAARKDVDNLSGGGALLIETPEGVYSVYETNLVSDSNAKVNEIDEPDSTGGILMEKQFRCAWLKVSSGKVSNFFKVY